MKPHRIRMTHNLILNYGLYRKMEVYVRAAREKLACRSVRSFLAAAQSDLGRNDPLSQ